MGQGKKSLIAFAAMAAMMPAAAFSSAGEATSTSRYSAEILRVHNQERAPLGLRELVWSSAMEADARAWAKKMASEGRIIHATQAQRSDAGENLWAGPAGYFGPDVIVGTFLTEKSQFKPGKFPYISRTGRWQDVGHYSQIIWPSTREVGCASVESNGTEYFVCRYWPGGNWIGQEVG